MKDNSKFKVLFIDDEPASLTAFKSIFRDDYDILLASSAEEGYKMMQKEDVNIVISDQRMPGVTGVEFLQRIRIEFPDTVRMLITGYSDIDAVIQSINGSSISYYFSKPYNETDMKIILDNTIEKIKLMKENRMLLEKLQTLVTELTEQKETLEKEIVMRLNAESELTQAREKAEESSRLKSSLLANLNHEFRTPMNSILGFSDMIRTTGTEKEVTEMANIVFFSGKRLLKTLNAIVDLARLESEPHPTNIEKVNLSELALRIFNDFNEIAVRKNILMNPHIQSDVCTMFNTSSATLIITNLIDNAIKFTHRGSIEVLLTKERSGDTEQAVFDIRDTGIGIHPAYHEKIFDEFRQVSEGFGRFYEGLGIGLSLSKKLLKRLKGEISLESEVGKGTRFIVRFPVCSVPTREEELSQKETIGITPESTKEPPPEKTQRFTILSVEDNEYNQELIEIYLKDTYHLEMVYDGESAIAFAREKPSDMVLMDINLGAGIDGVMALQKIRELKSYQTVPVIAVTGYTSEVDKQNLLAAGFDEFLPKPFNKSQLNKIIQETFMKSGKE